MLMATLKEFNEIKNHPKQRQTQVELTVLYIMM